MLYIILENNPANGGMQETSFLPIRESLPALSYSVEKPIGTCSDNRLKAALTEQEADCQKQRVCHFFRRRRRDFILIL